MSANQAKQKPLPEMYKLNPYYTTSEVIATPDCMYRLSGVYDNSMTKENMENISPEVAALEKRQIDILQRLEILKVEVEKLTLGQRSSATLENSTASFQQSTLPSNGVLQDIVINANPCNPPLSLLVLHKLLVQQHKVLAACYTHSSVSSVPECLKRMFTDNGIVATRSGYQFGFTLIWKDDKSGTSMMLSPNIQTAVYGEANIARYIARLINPAYDSTDIVAATEIDYWLDLATQIIHGNNKERAAVLRTLNARLGRSSWLVGSGLSLADIMLWSALQQNKMTQAVPANVKKWLEACNQNTLFEQAKLLADQL